MLSDEVLDRVIERLTTRINKGNEYVLRKMGESVKKIGTLTPSQAQELEQILKYGGDYEKIAQELARLTDMNVADIYKIFEEVAKNDYQFAKQFYKYRGVKYIPFDENEVLKRQVDAIAKITAQEYLNLARTSVLGYAVKNSKGQLVFKKIKQVYYELIDEAILNVSQGKETFDEVMYRKLKEIGQSGLKVVYPTTYIGKDKKEHHYIRRLDSAISMNIKDGIRMLHNETQQQFGKEFKSDGVEISVHLNPAPDHQFVQGKQFTINKYDKDGNLIKKGEFEKFQDDEDAVSYDGVEFPAISEETGHDRRSIGEYNCYHYIFSIVLGISQPEYTKEQLQDIINKNNEGFEFEGKHYTNYEGLQLQRKIELEIRKAKDNQILGRASNNTPLINESQQRIRLLNDKYKKLNQVSGLPSSIDRARVSGYQRIKINNLKEIEYARENNQIWHSTDSLKDIINSNKITKPSIAVGRNLNTTTKYGSQFIIFKPEILENVSKETILYNGDGGNEYLRNNKKFNNLMNLLKDNPKKYNELKFNNDLEFLKYIKKVYIRQGESKELIDLLKENKIKYQIYKDVRIRT